MKAIKTFIAALAVCGSAHAEFYSGNDLLDRLNGNEYQKLLGMGYIAGVSDALQRLVICVPESVTLGQIRDMIKSHLETNVANRHYSADSLISNHLIKVWPCAKKGGVL